MRRRLSMATVLASLLIALSTGVASAHGLTVQPPAQDEPAVSGPVSRAWAQAHCHAQAPEAATAASGGVVAFSPAGALPCSPDDTNPAGKVTGP